MQSACITIIEIGNSKNEVVFDRQMVFDKYPLYYMTRNKLISMKDFVPEIVGLEQKTKRSIEIMLKKPLVTIEERIVQFEIQKLK